MLGSSAAPVPADTFPAAYLDLCARIWLELEQLGQAANQVEAPGSPLQLITGAAVLRLDLIVLADRCHSSHWRRVLSAEQRDRLCSTLTEILAALHVESEDLIGATAAAQNKILDELSTYLGMRFAESVVRRSEAGDQAGTQGKLVTSSPIRSLAASRGGATQPRD